MHPNYIEPSPQAKPLLFILAALKRLPDNVYNEIEKAFRTIEYKGEARIFDCTDYYREEFGNELYRHVICFRQLMDPSQLINLKWKFHDIEKQYSSPAGRLYNLDAGYLDTDKLVLGSFKRGKNKLYLGEDVYGDMLLEYSKGRFYPMKWAFKDFQDGRYQKDLMVVREKLKADIGRSK